MQNRILIIFTLLAAIFSFSACDNIKNRGFNVNPKTAIPDQTPLSMGKVIDEETNKPLPGATVTINGSEVVYTNENGVFNVKSPVTKVAARAYGYTRKELIINEQQLPSQIDLRLRAITPKALYLTVYGIGSKKLRESALKIIDETEVNSLVIDMKGDRGLIPYKSGIPLASSIGAQKIITVKDIKELVKSLKERGIYTIARVVVFKDNLLGSARPELTVRDKDGKIWRDREKLIWMDPFQKEVWEYNISIALEAAQNGFDEIQFDYVRFPDHNGLKFSIPTTEENRVAAISGFLTEARKRLIPYNVFVAADIFGYAAWNLDDTKIGQKIDQLAPAVDYISLMLYPSGFHLGIPGYRNAVANSNRIVYLTLKKAQERSNLPPVRFRPWLQAFKDYAFDRRQFAALEIKEQIKATEEFGSGGWMFWNPRNNYKSDGLKKKTGSNIINHLGA
jgi:hypothetical protein